MPEAYTGFRPRSVTLPGAAPSPELPARIVAAAPELRQHRMSGTSRRPATRASASPVENAPNRTSPASEIFKMIGDRPNLDSAQCAVYRSWTIWRYVGLS